MRRSVLLFLFAVAVFPPALLSKGTAHHSSGAIRSGSGSPAAARTRAPHAAPKSKAACASCPRDARGRIARSSSAKERFQKSHPCPSTGKTSGPCPGYVVDHIRPLKRGGADAPANMQWQTTASAKAKDKIE
jgi:hypothetical protein